LFWKVLVSVHVREITVANMEAIVVEEYGDIMKLVAKSSQARKASRSRQASRL